MSARITRLFVEILAEDISTQVPILGTPSEQALIDDELLDLPPPTEQTAIQLKRSNGLDFDLIAALDTTTCFIETRDLDLGDPAAYKFVQRLFFEILNREEAPGLQVIVKYRNTLNDAFQEMEPQLLNTNLPIHLRVPGAKYHRYRIEDNSVRTDWRLAAFEIWGELGGSRV